MYYKIRHDILFRKYSHHGYITDNSEFGYRFLNNDCSAPGEKYVSESGAVMLAALDKSPKHIDKITEEIALTFIDEDFETLREDAIDFFNYLADCGYLNRGNTPEICNEGDYATHPCLHRDEINTNSTSDDGSRYQFHPNDFFRSIHIEVTSQCNERCLHCYIPPAWKNGMMDSSLFFRILEESMKMNVINVTLSGGEPLMHKDFLKFLEQCREMDLSVNVLSNLTLLTEDILLEMKRNPLLSVQTSIYSMIPDVHDSITNLKGSFAKTKAAFLRLRAEGIPLQISCPVMKQNKDSFFDVLKWGREHDVVVAIEPVIYPVYDHSRSNLENRLSLKELDDVIDKQVFDGYGDMMKTIAKEKEAQTANHPVCTICRYKLCVGPDGTVFPCVGWQNNVIGDLNQQSLRDIWENSPQIASLRKITRSEFPRCVTCDDRGYCTVCMMCNANENQDGNAFHINDFHCQAAAARHAKVDAFFKC